MLRQPRQRLGDGLRGLPAALGVTAWLTGLIVVLVGVSASLPIVFQAASNAALPPAQTASWIWAVTFGTGVTSVFLSLWFRQPVVAAWSTPGAALLVTSLAHYTYSEAIGAYLVAGVAMTLLGVSGLFGRVMRLVPRPVVMGMLGGVLLRFGVNLFNVLPTEPILVIGMAFVFFALRRVKFRAPAAGALVVGLAIAALGGKIHLEGVSFLLTTPVLTAPTFTLEALLGLALPLFALAVTAQNAPALAVMRAAGYDTNIDEATTITGAASVVTAPFGGHGITLAAITAAIAAGEEAHPDPTKRFAAAFASGVWYMLIGSVAAALTPVFAGLPSALIAAIAGLALVGVLITALSGAMADSANQEAGLVAFLCTAANFTWMGIAAPFWGLVAGVLVYAVMQWGKHEKQGRRT